MGSGGRTYNGGAAAGGSGAEEKRTIAALPAEVPTSAASVDISLPLPEMTPHIMQVPSALPPLLGFAPPLPPASLVRGAWFVPCPMGAHVVLELVVFAEMPSRE
jgi:hypothetical protein